VSECGDGRIFFALVSFGEVYKRYRHVLRQFIKFGMVGAAGVAVNMLAAILMNKANGGTANAQRVLFAIPGTEFNFRYTSLVWIVAFVVANIFNFQLNRTWTFRGTAKAPWFHEFWPFLAVGSAAAFLGLFIKIGFTNPTSPLYLPSPWFHEDAGLHSREYWAQLLTIFITMPINFAANKLWTFRHVRRRYAREQQEVNG
jgi:putative flippase GtrA